MPYTPIIKHTWFLVVRFVYECLELSCFSIVGNIIIDTGM